MATCENIKKVKNEKNFKKDRQKVLTTAAEGYCETSYKKTVIT